MNPLKDKNILLGVTGSIAAYKAADLASKLAQAGARVHAILTHSATHFIQPLTFQSVTGQRAYSDADLWGSEAHVLHIGLARQADLLVIAPASATTIARLAQGLADNLLSVTALALGTGSQAAPVLLAPAMDAGMYGHAATQANLATLAERGIHQIGPEAGHLASGLVAKGRMSEPLEILGRCRYLLSRAGALAGKRVLVTAGGTQEPLDPVRVLSNRSSGKQGFALAQAALDAGAEVQLIAAPGSLQPPAGCQLTTVETASQMQAAVLAACPDSHILFMAAAVADYRPAEAASQKIKKSSGTTAITLTPNPDILQAVADLRMRSHWPQVVVGFAAETEDLLKNAQAKLQSKRLDLMVANDVSASDAGFGADTNRVTLLGPDQEPENLPLLSKAQVAERIVQRTIQILEKKQGGTS